MYSVQYVQCTVCTVYTMYSVHYVQCTLCTVYSMGTSTGRAGKTSAESSELDLLGEASQILEMDMLNISRWKKVTQIEI